jgi:hypothetical protein
MLQMRRFSDSANTRAVSLTSRWEGQEILQWRELGTMQNDEDDKSSESPIPDQEPRCPACGGLPRVHVKFLDSQRGKMIRLYRCKCGARVWDD